MERLRLSARSKKSAAIEYIQRALSRKRLKRWAMLAMLAQIVVGFAMATLGVALLCLGEVPFLAGKRILALRSRLIGVILVSFLPLALGLRQASNFLFGPDTIEGPVLTWSFCGFCWFVVIVMLFRVVVPKRAPRQPSAAAAGSKENPFGATKAVEIEEGVEEIEPWAETPPAQKAAAKKARADSAKKPPTKNSPKPAADDLDPFDFS
jgi:hypothetical protein